jgi:preprotein translocase subunit Sss1
LIDNRYHHIDYRHGRVGRRGDSQVKLIGRRSVASVLRWMLGFVNVFVMIGVIGSAVGLIVSLVAPETAAGFIDGLAHDDAGEAGILMSQRMIYVGAFVATFSTWWILNRLRRIFLAVNQGDAFEFANVGRLQGIGLGLIGVQLSALLLALTVPESVPGDADYSLDLGSWLGILIVFMLAEVFRQGASIRDDQQMTV